MVYVPFFNITLPEPRLAVALPEAVSTVIHAASRVLVEGHDVLHPPSPEDLQQLEEQFVEEEVPREFNRVRKRYAEGKILDDEQLSSELEDASFDWYRRMLRTSVLGATDEEMEDVAARKLGLSQPSLQEAVQMQHLQQAVANGLDLEAEKRQAQQVQALAEREADLLKQLAARKQRLAELRRQVRPSTRQAISAMTNASAGMLLGVLMFKSVLVAASRLFRRRKPKQRPQPQKRQPQPQSPPKPPANLLEQLQQQQRAAAAAAAQQAAARQPAGAQRQQQQSQSQEQAGKAQAGTISNAASQARKTRTVKKR